MKILKTSICHIEMNIFLGCCVYQKPRAFGESSSESESDDENGGHNAYCPGHNKKHKHKHTEKPEDS